MVGNFMNSGSRNAQSLGFDIQYLTRVRYLNRKKSNLSYARGIAPKYATSSGVRIRCLALGQRFSEMSLRW